MTPRALLPLSFLLLLSACQGSLEELLANKEVLPKYGADAPEWTISSSSFNPTIAEDAAVTTSVTFDEQDGRTIVRARALGQEMNRSDAGIWSVTLPWELLEQEAIREVGSPQDDVSIDVFVDVNEVGNEAWVEVAESPTLIVNAKADFEATSDPLIDVSYPIGNYLSLSGYSATLTIRVSDALAIGEEVKLNATSGSLSASNPRFVDDSEGGAVATSTFTPTIAGMAQIRATLGGYTGSANVATAAAPTSNGNATLFPGGTRIVKVTSFFGQIAECQVSIDAPGVFVEDVEADTGEDEIPPVEARLDTINAQAVYYTFGVNPDAETDGTLSLLCWDDYLQEHLVILTADVK